MLSKLIAILSLTLFDLILLNIIQHLITLDMYFYTCFFYQIFGYIFVLEY